MVVMHGKSLSITMNARTAGSGDDTVVLAHGYGGDQSVWDKIVPHLAQRHRVVVFDWSFSGAVKDQNFFDPVKYSSFDAFADDLISLLEEMNLSSSSSMVFVGHSMSGMIGCIASVKRPELFNRLILIGASPRYINSEDYEGGFENSDIDQLLSSIESNFHNWASNFASLAVGPNDSISIEKFQKCLKRMKPEVALSIAKLVFHSDQREMLGKVMTPCTIIQTTNDVVVPSSVADYMKYKIKGKSTVEMVDTDGHFPQLTAHLQLLENLYTKTLQMAHGAWKRSPQMAAAIAWVCYDPQQHEVARSAIINLMLSSDGRNQGCYGYSRGQRNIISDAFRFSRIVKF